MKGIKSFYTGLFLFATVFACAFILGQKIFNVNPNSANTDNGVIDSKYGNFLAAQHALYINDFENAAKMMSGALVENDSIKQVKTITDFFGGKMPENAADLKSSKDLLERLVYDAYLIQKDDWKNVYERRKKEDSLFAAPLRIFSGVKQGKTKEVLKFIDSMQTNDFWKSFMRGQIAVLNNDIEGAAKEFAKVHPEFMNINDYLYLMSFYQKNGMFEDMDILKDDFVSKPAGMYILDYPDIPDWSRYEGVKNQLVFSIIQTVSHTQMMMYTDLSLMFLRFAQIVSDGADLDAINYYLGQYYSNNNGDYKHCFNSIDKSSQLYLFGQLKIAEKAKDIRTIENIARKNPLFIPAVNTVVRENIKQGNKRNALRFINRGLKQKNLNDNGYVYFLKQRVHINLMFNDAKSAQKDMDEIKEMAPSITPDIMLLQARIWEKQNRNIDKAYEYAMNLIKMNTSDINAWDVLGLIVNKKEGINNALELMEKVGAATTTSSALFEHLGDLYMIYGDKDKAKRAYLQALDLSDDCLIVVPFVQKKVRKLK
jgi:tetratricopeptide (TPR) repeat protein